MKRKISLVFLLMVLAIGLVPVTASASACFANYLSCASGCAGIADGLQRSACGLDCSVDLAGCVRHALLD